MPVPGDGRRSAAGGSRTARWRILAGALLVAACLDAHAVPDTMEQRAKACTGCHGLQGQSRPDGYVPRLAGKPAGYLLVQMQNFRDGHRAHVTMARMLENLDDAMLRELGTYFAAQDVPYPPPASVLPMGDAARRAEALVRNGDARLDVPACSSCHGERLTGIAPYVPGLVGLPRDYLVAQLGAWRQGARRAREPDCMATIARRLGAADVAIVSQWLAAQPVPVPSAPATTAPTRWPLECGALSPVVDAGTTSSAPASADTGVVARGAYLARVGNCAGCHTAPDGKRYAGGRGIRTPFGTVYAGNLTPDDATGLGRWSSDDFWRALHEGRSRDGRRLVPAFPYTSYTRVARADADAIYAYLRSLAPVRQPSRPHELRFSFGTQAALAAWQWLFFEPGRAMSPIGPVDADAPGVSASTATGAATAAPTSDASAARGASLVWGLGHCDACHAPRNRWGAPAKTLTGGVIPGQGWYAPSLHPVARGTSVDEIVTLLRTGRNARGSVTGPMASVVRESTQHWSDADLHDAAAYLASLSPAPRAAVAPAPVPADVRTRGERLYVERCADCHGRDGRGVPGAYPPLAGNPTVLAPNVDNLVQALRHGVFGPTTAAVPRPYGMPPADLDGAPAAALLSYIRQAWGNAAPEVLPVDVARVP